MVTSLANHSGVPATTAKDISGYRSEVDLRHVRPASSMGCWLMTFKLPFSIIPDVSICSRTQVVSIPASTFELSTEDTTSGVWNSLKWTEEKKESGSTPCLYISLRAANQPPRELGIEAAMDFPCRSLTVFKSFLSLLAMIVLPTVFAGSLPFALIRVARWVKGMEPLNSTKKLLGPIKKSTFCSLISERAFIGERDTNLNVTLLIRDWRALTVSFNVSFSWKSSKPWV